MCRNLVINFAALSAGDARERLREKYTHSGRTGEVLLRAVSKVD